MSGITIHHLLETKIEPAELLDSDTLSQPLALRARVAGLTEDQKEAIVGGTTVSITQWVDVSPRLPSTYQNSYRS